MNRGGLRLSLGIGAMVALLVVVALGSASRSTVGVGDTGSTAIFDEAATETFFTAIAALVFVATLALAIVVLLRMLRNRDQAPGESEQVSVLDVEVPWWVRLLIGVLLFVATIVGIVLIIRLAGALQHDRSQTDLGMLTDRPTPENATPTPAEALVGSAITLVVLFLVLVGAGGALYVIIAGTRDRLHDLLEDEPDDDDVTYGTRSDDPFAFDLDALRMQDERQAIVIAFALTERLTRAVGWPREWSETSAEYVRRVRPLLPPAGAEHLGRLLVLFHEAKFSEHPIDARQRDDALAALDALRDALAPIALAAASASAAAGEVDPA